MATRFTFGNAPRFQPKFDGRENTSSGRPKRPMELESGVKDVAKALGSGEPGKATGFRPGGYGPGYDCVGGKTGMQAHIPKTRDQSNVHANKGVNPEDILTGGAHGPDPSEAK